MIRKRTCGPNLFYALFWFIDDFEKVNISWITKQQVFSLFFSWNSKMKGRAEGSQAGCRLSLPIWWPGSSLWDWRSDKSFKTLNAREASGYAKLIYRWLSKILYTARSLCMLWSSPTLGASALVIWLNQFVKQKTCSWLCWKGPGALSLSWYCRAEDSSKICRSRVSCSRRQMGVLLQMYLAVTGMYKGIGTLKNLSFLGCCVPAVPGQKVNFSSALSGVTALN